MTGLPVFHDEVDGDVEQGSQHDQPPNDPQASLKEILHAAPSFLPHPIVGARSPQVQHSDVVGGYQHWLSEVSA